MQEGSEARHPSKPISTLGALAWTLAVVLASSTAVQITESARPGAIGDLVNVTTCLVLAHSVLVFAILRVYGPEASVRDALGFRAPSPLGVILAIAGGAAMSPVLGLVDELMTKRFPPPPDQAEMIDRLLQANTLGERLVLVVALGLVMPFFEELFFDGALFGGLRRGRPELSAVIGVAALFAISRGDVRGFPSSLAQGLGLAALRGRSGSVVPAIVGHITFSLVPLVAIAIGKADYDFGTTSVVVSGVVVVLTALAAAFVFRGDARAERSRLLDL